MNRLKALIQHHGFELLIAAAILAIYSYAAFSEAHNFPNRWYTRDDAYYYFKVAQNISEGKGVTFDGINPTNGFHPLWMLICIPLFALARFDLILPLRVLTLVLGVISAASAILLFHFIRRVLSPEIAAFAALYWGFDKWIFQTVTQSGLETPLAALLLILFLDQIERFGRLPRNQTNWRQAARLGLIAALLLLSRLDLIYLVMIAGVWVVLQGQPLRPLLIADFLIAATSLYAVLLLRLGTDGVFQYSSSGLIVIGLGFALKAPILYFLGMYPPARALPLRTMIVRTLLANGTAGIALVGLTGLLPGGFPRSVILMEAGLCSLLMILVRCGALALAQTQAPNAPLRQVLTDHGREWLSRAVPYYVITLGILAAYMLYNFATLGTLTPVSGQIKHWWGSLGGNVYGGAVKTPLEFFGFDPASTFRPWDLGLRFFIGEGSEAPDRMLIATAAIALLAITILALDRKRAARAITRLGVIPLAAGGGFQILYYAGQGYAGTQEWYWIAQMLLILLADCIVIDILIHKIRRLRLTTPAARLSVGMLGLGLALGFGSYVIEKMPYQSIDAPYMTILPLLEDNTEPGSLIGMTGGGNIGYYIQDRTIVNMDGLINSPAYFQALQEGRGGEYLAAMGLDYVFANPDIVTQTQPYSRQFKNYYLQPVSHNPYGNKQLLRFMPINPP